MCCLKHGRHNWSARTVGDTLVWGINSPYLRSLSDVRPDLCHQLFQSLSITS
ncbi:MAG: hypothetical protein H7832_14415 [Magnetococcus sp. DMHC-6]